MSWSHITKDRISHDVAHLSLLSFQIAISRNGGEAKALARVKDLMKMLVESS